MEDTLSQVPQAMVRSPVEGLTQDITNDNVNQDIRKRYRTVISPRQLCKLEELYVRNQWPKRSVKESLAHEIGTTTNFVNNWFQNKRSRIRKVRDGNGPPVRIKKRMDRKKTFSGLSKHHHIPIAPKPGPMSQPGLGRPRINVPATLSLWQTTKQSLKGDRVVPIYRTRGGQVMSTHLQRSKQRQGKQFPQWGDQNCVKNLPGEAATNSKMTLIYPDDHKVILGLKLTQVH